MREGSLTYSGGAAPVFHRLPYYPFRAPRIFGGFYSLQASFCQAIISYEHNHGDAKYLENEASGPGLQSRPPSLWQLGEGKKRPAAPAGDNGLAALWDNRTQQTSVKELPCLAGWGQ